MHAKAPPVKPEPVFAQCGRRSFFQDLQRIRLFDTKLTNTGATQNIEVSTAAQLLPEVVGNSADVCPFAAADQERNFRQAEISHLKLADIDHAGLALHRLPDGRACRAFVR